jgi:hypothetical protein
MSDNKKKSKLKRSAKRQVSHLLKRALERRPLVPRRVKILGLGNPLLRGVVLAAWTKHVQHALAMARLGQGGHLAPSAQRRERTQSHKRFVIVAAIDTRRQIVKRGRRDGPKFGRIGFRHARVTCSDQGGDFFNIVDPVLACERLYERK